MGKLFTEEDIKMLASHMTPVMDKIAEIKKESGAETISLYAWKYGDYTIKVDGKWSIYKSENRYEANYTEERMVSIDLSEKNET